MSIINVNYPIMYLGVFVKKIYKVYVYFWTQFNGTKYMAEYVMDL